MAIKDSTVVFNNAEALVLRHTNDTRKNRDKLILEGGASLYVDAHLINGLYNIAIHDYIYEYEAKKETFESEIEESNNKIHAIYNEFENDPRYKELGRDLSEVAIALQKEREELVNLYQDIQSLKKEFDAFHEIVKKWGASIRDTIKAQDTTIASCTDKLLKIVEKYKTDLSLYTDAKKVEVEEWSRTYIQNVQLSNQELISKIEEELVWFLETRKKEIESLYELPENVKLEKHRNDLLSINNRKVSFLSKDVSDHIGLFLKNVGWLIVLLFLSMYDFFFLKKIFVDIFRIDGGDPYNIGPFWVQMLAAGVLFALIIIFTILSKMHERGKWILSVTTKLLLSLIVFIVICMSLIDAKNIHLKDNFDLTITMNADGTMILEFIFRLLMIPIIIVGDFILTSMVKWEEFNIIHDLFRLILFPFYFFYLTIIHIGKQVYFVSLWNWIEKKKAKMIVNMEENDKKIRKLLKPELCISFDSSSVKMETSDDIEKPFSKNILFDKNAINAVSHFEETLSQLRNTVQWFREEIQSKISTLEQLIIPDANKKARIKNIIADKNRFIENLKAENIALQTIKSATKHGIQSGYAKYILSSVTTNGW